MSAEDRLLLAAKRALTVLNAIATGAYYGPSEDIQAARELHGAITAMETAQAQLRERALVQR